MQGAVAVQPLAYGGAHGCLIDALARIGERTCGVASVSRYSPPEEIDMLDRLGVCGTRLALHSSDSLQMLDEVSVLHKLLPPKWHIELVGEWRCLAKVSSSLVRCSRNFVGLCKEIWQMPLDSSDFKKAVWWMEMGNFYMKLVMPMNDVAQSPNGFHRMLLDLPTDLGDRLLWGSGWPNVSPRRALETPKGLPREMPKFLLDLEETLDLNAQALYGFAG